MIRNVWKKRSRFGLLAILLLVVLASCADAGNTGNQPTVDPAATAAAITPDEAGETQMPLPDTGMDYPNGQLLVDVGWVVDQADNPAVRIFDIRSPAAFEQGHIPGAVNIPIGDIVATVNDIPFEYEPERVQTALNESGLTPEMTAVIYDDLGMMNAARMFWTLEYVGHADTRVLNGGWNAWVDAGQETSTEPPEIASGEYPVEPDESKLISADEIVDRLGDPSLVIVDARSPQEYTGEVVLADRGGHIPTAVNLVWLDALEGGDAVYTIESDWEEQLQDDDVEVFKDAEELQAIIDELGISPDREIVTYCQTLWRGAHAYFLFRLMGFENVRGYDGSWVEWGNRSDLPVVEGADPGTPNELIEPSAE